MGAQSITTDNLGSDSVVQTKTKMSLPKRLNKLLTSSHYKVSTIQPTSADQKKSGCLDS